MRKVTFSLQRLLAAICRCHRFAVRRIHYRGRCGAFANVHTCAEQALDELDVDNFGRLHN